MTRWTQEQLDDYRNRIHFGHLLPPTEQESDHGPESKLQARIVAWCKEWGKPYLSFRQSRNAKGFLTPGWPDLTICLPSGRVLFIELKSAKGVVKAEQKAIHLQLMALGHEVHVIRSFKRFMEIVEMKSPGSPGR